jgi:hypothetical protein
MFWIAGEVAQQANRVHFPSMNIYSWCGTTVDGQIVAVLPLCGIIIPDFPLFALIPPPQWTVTIDYRPLYAESNPRDSSLPGTKYGLLGHWRHTYIQIDETFPGAADPIWDTWGVLGVDTKNFPLKGSNQEVDKNDPWDRDPRDGGATGGFKTVTCSDQDAQNLKAMLDSTVFPKSVCPSCGGAYHNGPIGRGLHDPFSFFNSNTYTYNMIYKFIDLTGGGRTVPPIKNAPGYYWSDRYSHYPF